VVAIHSKSQHDDDDNDDNEGDATFSDEENDDLEVVRSNEHAQVSMRGSDEQASPDTRLAHLIVVPASVVSNWEREFQTFAPDLHIVTYKGSMEEREDIQRELRPYLAKTRNRNIPMVDVILTSITYFQKEKSDDRDFLRKFGTFDYLVIDEGHMLKNSKGLRYRNLDRLKTCHRLLLTGTPVQNSPKELMALLCFLMPLFSRKNSHDFGDQKENDGGEAMLQHFVQLEGNARNNDNQSLEATAYRKLKQLFAPFVLRRRKQDVLSQILPPKIYQVERVTLDSRARTIYDGVIADHLQAKKNKTASATDHLFTKLRKAANHPLLLRTRYKTPNEVDHLAEYFYKYGAFRGEASSKERVKSELESFSDFEIHLTALELIQENKHRGKDIDRYILTEEDLFCSAKFVKLRSLLPELIGGGHRILIFSQWTTLLDLLGCLLENLDLSYRRMDGQTPVAERQSRIDEFNADESIKIFLLSTKACGLGINLTSADTCIMHDLDFNPFGDLQAEDRCHRIGQKKPVTIVKLVANESVDADIYDMQTRKSLMESAIMSSTDWSKQERKEKANVMKNVVDRFLLKSPQGQSSKGGQADAVEKENTVNLLDDSETEI
jgi:SWI/SNF-related matrix-associated actin-dependent regulator 1 of chromatin subfamily A